MTLTTQEYKILDAAFEFFNMRLFNSSLPPVMITFSRKRHAKGYFAGDRFVSRISKDKVAEIALNPDYFWKRTDKDILSTLVHEMVHLWQHYNGSPSRGNYHNRQWADAMERIGLMPSDTGKPGGNRTGQGMTHYIIGGGLFEKACDVFLTDDIKIGFNSVASASLKHNSGSKVNYQCPKCKQNAWAKPNASLVCGICNEALEAQE